MSDKKSPSLLGRLAVHLGMLTQEQVSECTREQACDANPKPAGEYFVGKGYLSRLQLQQLLNAQKRVIEQHQVKLDQHQQAKPRPVPGIEPLPQPQPAKPPPPSPEETAADNAAALKASLPTLAVATPKQEAPVVSEAAAPEVENIADVRFDPGALNALLKHGVDRGASDIHIHAGSSFKLRVQGHLVTADDKVMDSATSQRVLIGALGDEDRETLKADGQLDFCYSVEGLARFRANIFRQQSGYDGIFRVIAPRPPTLEDLGLPADLARFTNYHQGMVLVTGPTGCGKSSTLAALVDLVNEERKEHILTIEDPIEFQYAPKNCLVNQRSVKRHTESFARALRAGLREDPDVIVIGELRDLETISLAMTAAETGHFVLATLHTGGAIRTINRLIGAFPANQQDQIRTMLSESLRAVISQRLIPTVDGSSRVPALEILVVTKAVGNLIRENKTFQIKSIIQTGAALGMTLLDQSVLDLMKAGTITREEAMRYVEDPKILGES